MNTTRRAVKTPEPQTGLHHWWMQRLTAIALIPLTLWLTFSVSSISGAEYKEVIAELGSPLNAILIITLIIVAFYHAALGMQVVFEDYVSTIKTRTICIISTNLILLLLAVAGVGAVATIVFGGQ
jgi:succinate dehydrogenase / fumarate reductase membrane anchor subunit